ncbi:hypothetical protein [Gordonia polyisoprenivorans]|uniref:hypothetical protein n=1 Tax=Gordonia polyisoprenivorans TaxID=84595 RepID=UPI0002ED6A3E|nr:hypothetical protein [Gordonia polyisoprenivorans]
MTLAPGDHFDTFWTSGDVDSSYYDRTVKTYRLTFFDAKGRFWAIEDGRRYRGLDQRFI